jgi:HPt (histidine-containing phosphotransfer) domain-containing protein
MSTEHTTDSDDAQSTTDLQTLTTELHALRSRVESLETENETLKRQVDTQSERIDDLEARVDKNDQTRTDLAKNATQAKSEAEKAKEIARSASAKACQVEATLEEDTPGNEPERTQLPGDVEPSTSPLDFFANCRQYKVKQRFVDDRNEQNTYRALLVATRWEEFATKRTTGDGVFFSRDDVRQALTAIMGEQPHGTTITRVWDAMKELGGSDLEEKTRQVSPTQPTKEILAMDLETAAGLLEGRYCHLDLLEDGMASAGGVTPVVTQPPTEAA